MLTALAAVAFWTGGLLRLRAARADAEKRPLCFALLAVASGAVFDVDPFYAIFDRAVGVTNLSDLMAHGLGLVGVYFLLRTLDGLAAAPSQRSARWLLPFLAAALVLSVTLFAATPMSVETSAFTAHYADQPTIVAYWLISIAFPTLCLVQLAHTAHTHWHSPGRALRTGLRITGVGVALGFIYSALKLAEIFCQNATKFDLASALRPLDLTALGAGLSLIAVGLSVPSITAQAAPLIARAKARYLSYRLHWVWSTMCGRAGAADTLTPVAGPQFRLLRRVVEIRDAQATLWSYLTVADIRQVQAVLTRGGADTTSLTLEEAGLALALNRELAGATCERRPPHCPEPPRGGTTLTRSRPLDLDEEARELIRIGAGIKKAMRSNVV